MIVADLIRLLLKCPPGARVRHFPNGEPLNPYDVEAVWLSDDARYVTLKEDPPAFVESVAGLTRVE